VVVGMCARTPPLPRYSVTMPVFIGDYRCFPALHERYKALHERYKALHERYKALHERYIRKG
jgi:hypothetical protein